MISTFPYKFTAVGSSPPITMGEPTGVSMTVAASADPTITFDVTVELQVSNDGSVWATVGTVNLTDTDIVAVGQTSIPPTPWKFIRVNVPAITGTGAYADVVLGI